MLEVDKIINAGNCQLVIKWGDGKTQTVDARDLQARCPCVRCRLQPVFIDPEVKIVEFVTKGRLGIKVRFSSGCQNGIYSFREIRTWLKNSFT